MNQKNDDQPEQFKAEESHEPNLKKERKLYPASLHIEFFSQEGRDAFMAQARQSKKSRFPEEFISIERLFPAPPSVRTEIGAFYKWERKLIGPRLFYSEDTDVLREMVESSKVIYHFMLESHPSTKLIWQLYMTFPIKSISLKCDVSSFPFHFVEGKVCFITRRCRHEIENSQIQIRPDNIVYSISASKTPHPIRDPQNALVEIFKKNPERTTFEIQYAYICLISKCYIWRYPQGLQAVEAKYNLCIAIKNAFKNRLKALTTFILEGALGHPKQDSQTMKTIEESDWKIICYEHLKFDEHLEP